MPKGRGYLLGATGKILLCVVMTGMLWCGVVRAGTAEPIRFGMSAAFSGPSRGLGIELYRGASAYFNYVNANGGVHGRRVELLALDDGYNPLPAIANTIRLVEQDKVFALFSYVGTPTVTRILPLLLKYQDRNIYLLFPFTGAEPLRRPPYLEQVYNLRASYAQETSAIVDKLVSLGRTRIGIFYQADAYGRGGWDGVRTALERHGLKPVQDVAYPRGSGVAYSYAEQATLLHDAGVDAVICIGTYASCAGFIRDFRLLGDDVPVATLSFADADTLVRILTAMKAKDGRNYTENLLHTQVVPRHDNSSLDAVREYRMLMERFAQPLPPLLRDEGYVLRTYSAVSFEGYLNARLLVEMLWRMGPEPDKADIPRVLEQMAQLDIGLDVPARFGPQRHQGLDVVYFVTVDGDTCVPVTDWTEWAR